MSTPIRALFFDHTAELGGAEIALADLVRHLDPTRVDAMVLLGAEGPLLDRLRGHVPVQVLPMDPGVVRARRDLLGIRTLCDFALIFRTLKYLLRLGQFIRQQRPEILHTNSLKSAILGGIVGRMQLVTVIWHIRDRISGDYLPPAVALAVRVVARIIPNFIVANSQATLRALNAKDIPSAVVPSGVDLSRFSIAAGEGGEAGGHPSSGVRLVGLIGRICPWKGQHVFVEAAALVRARYPNIRFQIVGSALFSDQMYERQLRSTIQERSLGDCIELTGFREDVERAIRGLDIVVHASTLGEPFGQVIVQGMACGKPVVATNGGGVPEIVLHGETGLLVPMGDAPAMADAICRLLKDENAARRMGACGYQRVLDHFTIEAAAEKLMGIYESLAASRSGSVTDTSRSIHAGKRELNGSSEGTASA